MTLLRPDTRHGRAVARADGISVARRALEDDANTVRLDEREELADLVDAADSDDPDIDRSTAARYILAVSASSALSEPARDELVTLFDGSVSVDGFETWLNSDSTGTTIVRFGLRSLDE